LTKRRTGGPIKAMTKETTLPGHEPNAGGRDWVKAA
jgi:hypothetical protein